MPAYPACRRNCNGRAATFEGSADAPTIAMLRGASSARDNTGDGESVLLCGTGHGLSLIKPPLEDMLGNTVLENFG